MHVRGMPVGTLALSAVNKCCTGNRRRTETHPLHLAPMPSCNRMRTSNARSYRPTATAAAAATTTHLRPLTGPGDLAGGGPGFLSPFAHTSGVMAKGAVAMSTVGTPRRRWGPPLPTKLSVEAMDAGAP